MPLRSRLRIAAFVLALAVPVVAGWAAGASEVATEYDANVSFARFKTYSWGRKPESGKADADARIVEGLDARLKAAGWTLVESGPADARLAVIAVVTETRSLDTFYTGWGSGWGWSGPGFGAGVATTVRTGYRAGTLIVDIFDVSTKKLAWRGTATDTVTDDVQSNQRKLDQILTRMFAEFPPKPKAPQGRPGAR